jgi:hypothetical protein
MRNMSRALATAVAASVWVAVAAVPGKAQELSQQSIETLMEYAWQITPERFTKPNGQTVEIGNDRKTVDIPLPDAREIIRVSRLSAHAQVCDLKEEHSNNYRTMMAREAIKKKWTEPQMVYINQLHLVTVMMLTGRLKLIEKEQGKEPQVVEDNVGKQVTCTAEQRNKVRDAVMAYIKSGPQLAPADAAAGGIAPVPPAVPAAAKGAPAAPAKK